MRILCLIDFHPGARDWLWEHQAEPKDQVDFVIPPLQGMLSHTPKPLAYAAGNGLQSMLAAWRVLTRRYDLAAAWEGKNGLPFALLRRVFGLRKPPLVILAFTERGLLARRPGRLAYLLQAADRLVFPSRFDAQACAERLGIPAEKIRVCKIGEYDTEYLVEAPPGEADRTAALKVFAGGRSNRDFAVLLQAACGLPTAVQIAGKPPQDWQAGCPQAMDLHWTGRLGADEYLYRLANADIVVIPLLPGRYTAGLVDLIYAMACSRAIIATDAAGMAEYLQDGETGILVRPGDVHGLRAAIQRLIDQPQERLRLGGNARRAYLEEYNLEAFAGRIFPILNEAAACSIA